MKERYMMSINARIKSAFLVVAMLTASQASACSMPTISPKKAAVLGLVAMWVRLKTKGSSWNYKMSDWSEDLREVAEDYNIFDVALYKKFVALFDKYIIGRQLSVIDATYRTKNEDGTVVTLKDKKIKCTPFGLMGLFDAYVIAQLEKIGKISSDWENANKLFAKFDDVKPKAVAKPQADAKQQSDVDYASLATALKNVGKTVIIIE